MFFDSSCLCWDFLCTAFIYQQSLPAADQTLQFFQMMYVQGSIWTCKDWGSMCSTYLVQRSKVASTAMCYMHVMEVQIAPNAIFQYFMQTEPITPFTELKKFIKYIWRCEHFAIDERGSVLNKERKNLYIRNQIRKLWLEIYNKTMQHKTLCTNVAYCQKGILNLILIYDCKPHRLIIHKCWKQTWLHQSM
jgi:hypothetical protein